MKVGVIVSVIVIVGLLTGGERKTVCVRVVVAVELSAGARVSSQQFPAKRLTNVYI